MLDALVVLGWLQTSSLDALRNVVLGLLVRQPPFTG